MPFEPAAFGGADESSVDMNWTCRVPLTVSVPIQSNLWMVKSSSDFPEHDYGEDGDGGGDGEHYEDVKTEKDG